LNELEGYFDRSSRDIFAALADLFLRTAVWLREVDEADRRFLSALAIVAKAVAEGRNLAETG
jgi:hypothetical protein